MDIILVPVLHLLSTLLLCYTWVVISKFVLDLLITFNVVNVYNGFVTVLAEFLFKVTSPVLQLVRRFVPVIGSLDISYFVLLLLIAVLRNIVLMMISKF